VWVRPGSSPVADLKLWFTKQKPQPLNKAKDVGLDTWSNLFANAVVQWDFPFVGWNPEELADPIYGKQAIADSGMPKGSMYGQALHGNPIFAVPELDSADYVVEYIGEHSKVFLPLGTRLDYQPGEVVSTHSQMLSSTSETVTSWGLTLGLSAGIEKVLSVSAKGSYHEKIQYQQEHETRYSLTRRVRTDYVLFPEITNLRLAKGYKDAVFSNLRTLNEGGAPDWGNFVENYGTHYVHALTYGQTDFAETRYSLDAEFTALEQGFKLEENAEASLEGIKFGEQAAVEHDWGGKLGKKVSTEDVEHRVIGAHGKPAAIFLDLRPAWELFSPVFFRPT
jgi:hypothetical protein